MEDLRLHRRSKVSTVVHLYCCSEIDFASTSIRHRYSPVANATTQVTTRVDSDNAAVNPERH
ncbi:MAG: hypothetical protein JNL58_19270 [Planctomyces sp.]|nr:hypothetical protein [Planctomyces sp.]